MVLLAATKHTCGKCLCQVETLCPIKFGRALRNTIPPCLLPWHTALIGAISMNNTSVICEDLFCCKGMLFSRCFLRHSQRAHHMAKWALVWFVWRVFVLLWICLKCCSDNNTATWFHISVGKLSKNWWVIPVIKQLAIFGQIWLKAFVRPFYWCSTWYLMFMELLNWYKYQYICLQIVGMGQEPLVWMELREYDLTMHKLLIMQLLEAGQLMCHWAITGARV